MQHSLCLFGSLDLHVSCLCRGYYRHHPLSAFQMGNTIRGVLQGSTRKNSSRVRSRGRKNYQAHAWRNEELIVHAFPDSRKQQT